MPTRKQRRRRAKELRHDYVWEDEEGNELERDEVKEKRSDSSSQRAPARPVREPQSPSWRRSLRRGAIFAPVMVVVVMLLSSGLTLTEQLFQAAFIVGIFIPFSYLLDRVMYRSYKRRVERRAAGNGRGS